MGENLTFGPEGGSGGAASAVGAAVPAEIFVALGVALVTLTAHAVPLDTANLVSAPLALRFFDDTGQPIRGELPVPALLKLEGNWTENAECSYWDVEDEIWSQEGVRYRGVDGNTVLCE